MTRPQSAAGRRLPYLALTQVEGAGAYLCLFCKYGKGMCEYVECEHPLEVPGKEECLEPGDDCWGFRSKTDIETAADAVGVFLQGHERYTVPKVLP